MSGKRNNKSARPSAPDEARKGPPPADEGRIPDVPPMADPRLPLWPLIVVLAAFVIWLIWLAFLAAHSGHWTWLPG